MATLERPIRHGMLTKRSISKSKTTFNARFQERWFVLTSSSLTYHTPNGQTLKGRIEVSRIRCCECVEKETFGRSQVFQVAYLDKDKLRALYLQGSNKQEQDEWMQSIRLATEKLVGELMLPYYHKGAFLKKKWSCCKKDDKHDSGCCNTYNRSEVRARPISAFTELPKESSTSDNKKNSIKRKISLHNIVSSLKIDSQDSLSSDSSDKRKSKSQDPVEDDVFSDGDISEDEFSSFKTKNSLDSSGNSPGFDSGRYL